jgi:hypothetical protein
MAVVRRDRGRVLVVPISSPALDLELLQGLQVALGVGGELGDLIE